MLFSTGLGSEDFINLRARAERMLHTLEKSNRYTAQKDIPLPLQELQTLQTELKTQNDELRAVNEQLRMQQIKLSGFYDLAPVGYFILDNAGQIQEINRAGINLLDTWKDDVTLRSLQVFIVPRYTDVYYRFYKQLLLTRQRHTCELKMVSKGGREFYAHMEGIGIESGINASIECYLAVIDVTERIQAEQKQAGTNERLRLALEASSSGIWELNPETMEFYLDEFSSNLCGVTAGKFDGSYRSFFNLIHPADRELVDHHFLTSLNNYKEIDVVCRFLNNHNHICYASIRGHITEDSMNRRFVGIMMDITDKKRIEEEATRLKHDQHRSITKAILDAQENEQKRISDALHDGVSQLIYGIKMKLAACPDKLGTEGDDIRELLDMAIHEIRNISFELAPSLLTDFGLSITVEELAKRLSTPKMTIKTKIIDLKDRLSLPLETNIFRIIQELINNCMKHAGADTIQLEIRKNKFIEIKVKDNGVGFNAKAQESNPSGSGLSSIKNRLSLYNGTMSIASTPGSGTTVKIILNADK